MELIHLIKTHPGWALFIGLCVVGFFYDIFNAPLVDEDGKIIDDHKL